MRPGPARGPKHPTVEARDARRYQKNPCHVRVTPAGGRSFYSITATSERGQVARAVRDQSVIGREQAGSDENRREAILQVRSGRTSIGPGQGPAAPVPTRLAERPRV